MFDEMNVPAQSDLSTTNEVISVGARQSRPTDLPALRQTITRLRQLALRREQIDAQQLTEVILDDPLMTVWLLADVASLRAKTSSTINVTGAILMLGVEPFFERYAELVPVEELLAAAPDGLAEFRRLVRLSRRAARLGGAFCVPCNDPDVGAIYVAGLLHAVSRLILCIQQPACALRRSGELVLVSESAQMLTEQGLPGQFINLVAGDCERLDPQMKRVSLAIQIAATLESGWSAPAMAPLLSELAASLGLSLARVRALVAEVRI